jgi:histidine triad (HIT) family protein
MKTKMKDFLNKENKKVEDCVFCDESKIKSKVTEIDNCLVFEPLDPVVKGHLLVVNKSHTNDFTDDSETFSQTCKVASEVAMEIGGEFNLITSKGKNATQSVFHCHIHLVPREEDDGLKLPWS